MSIINDHERYTAYQLNAGERPKWLYEYWVTGRGEFPFDMLRYDQCWPVEDCSKLNWSFGAEKNQTNYQRSIKMRSNHEPTIARWSSFLWSVSKSEFKFAPTPEKEYLR